MEFNKDAEPKYEFKGIILTERQKIIATSKCFRNVSDQFTEVADILDNATDALYLKEKIEKYGEISLTGEEMLKLINISSNIDKITEAPDKIEDALNKAVKAMELIRTLYNI